MRSLAQLFGLSIGSTLLMQFALAAPAQASFPPSVLSTDAARSKAANMPTFLPRASEPAIQRKSEISEADVLEMLYQAESSFNAESYEQALAEFERALEITRDQNWQNYQVIALAYIGRVYLLQTRYADALTVLQDAYDLALQVDEFEENQFIRAQLQLSIGWAFSETSQIEAALNAWQLALEHDQVASDPQTRASILHGMGTTYALALGQHQEGLKFCGDALNLAQQYAEQEWSPYAQAGAMGCLGIAYQNSGQYEASREFHQQSLELARQANDTDIEFMALINLGWNYQERGEFEAAILHFEQAYELVQGRGTPIDEAAAMGNLGYSYGHIGEFAKSFELLEEALSIVRPLGNRYWEWRAYRAMGVVLGLQNEPELAIVFYKEATNITEDIRQDIDGLSLESQQSFLTLVEADYRVLADLLLQAGRIPEAQQVLDLLKLEELREFTDTTRATWSGNELQYTEIEQPVIEAHGSLIALGQEIYACRQRRCDALNDLRTEQRTLTTAYENQVTAFETAIARGDRTDDQFQDPRDLSDGAYELLQANPDALLIYPFVTEEKLWLLWASAGGAVGSIAVEAATQGELARVVQQLGEQLQAPGDLTTLQATSNQLYQWLIQPLETELEQNNIQQLIFVNDRVTRYIPMAALFDGDRYLAERYTLSTVITPGTTDTTKTLGSVDEVEALAVGLTEPVAGFRALPAVDAELDAVVRSDGADAIGLYPGQVLLNDEFTLAAIQANVEFKQILHIASHAEFAPSRPEDSFIVLGDSQKLSFPEIETMQESLRDLHLVVLSACETALGGTAGDGTEIAGISSYFLAENRAETVIASLWAVNDDSTSILMQRFYEFLASGEFTKAEALQQAQLSLLNAGEVESAIALRDRGIGVEAANLDAQANRPAPRSHPYYWAPFILIGNGL